MERLPVPFGLVRLASWAVVLLVGSPILALVLGLPVLLCTLMAVKWIVLAGCCLHWTGCAHLTCLWRSWDPRLVSEEDGLEVPDCWPVPVLRWLAGQGTEKAMLANVCNREHLTEALTWSGVLLAHAGQWEAARERLDRVEQEGSRNSLQFPLALETSRKIASASQDAGPRGETRGPVQGGQPAQGPEAS